MSSAQCTNTVIQCDVAPCNWSQPCEFSDIPKWHRQPCPKCGKGEIVSDADLAVYCLVQAAVEVTNIIDPNGTLPRTTMYVNTAQLRDDPPQPRKEPRA